jgi:hypothetical protein
MADDIGQLRREVARLKNDNEQLHFRLDELVRRLVAVERPGGGPAGEQPRMRTFRIVQES